MGLPGQTAISVFTRRFIGTLVIGLSVATVGPAGFASPIAAAAARPPSRLAADGDNLQSRLHVASAERATASPRISPRVSPTCDSQFHLVPGANPGPAANVILNNSLAAVSANSVWGVGAQADWNGQNVGPDRTLAEYWDGNVWNATTTPNPGTGNNDLWGDTVVPGAATAANNVWAVGDSSDATTKLEQSMALKWDGNAWQASSVPQVGTGNNILLGVAAITATNVWAVGDTQPDANQSSQRSTLTVHYDGASWSVISSPNVANSDNRLVAVAGSGANDVWAVGRSIDATPALHTLIEHYTGTSWSIVPSPNPGNGGYLYGVTTISPTLAYAVGNYADAGGASHNLVEKWDGNVWSQVVVPEVAAGTKDNSLFSVSAPDANNVWVAGAVYAPTDTGSPSDTLVERFDGTSWKIVPSLDGASGSYNEFNSVLAIGPTNIWAAGDYINSQQTQQLTLFENLCMSVPTVTGVVPISGNTGGGTSVAISGSDFNFATDVKFGSTSATSFTVNSNNQITATTPAEATGTVDVTVTNPAGTSAANPPADTYIYVPPAVSWKQYSLTGNNGSTWQPIDSTALSLTITPPGTTGQTYIVTGNADLWTSVAGVNQDIGITVSGGVFTTPTLLAWKESGGFAGTYSPNAASVQTVISLTGPSTYTLQLVWKTNKATTGTIFAAAGNGPAFSPTRLTAELVPPTEYLGIKVTNTQYHLTGSNGSTWQDIDGTNLVIANYMPTVSGSAIVSANADLWTATAGVNQDIGIFVSGGSYGAGQIVGWKESGGFAGTFSPNAAYVQQVVNLAVGQTYTFKIQWKANKATTGTIYAAAGGTGNFSPTRLTVHGLALGSLFDYVTTNSQFSKTGSTGSDWSSLNANGFKTPVNTGATPSVWALSGNIDLWTATAGVNQDVGIFISGGAFGSGTLVAWKESGGFAGTFSPNAAFVQTVIPLAASTTYTVELKWKANKPTSGTIYAGAGGTGNFSSTMLLALQMN